jgi:natural product precursor
MKKRLKKLILKKEEIASLTDEKMNLVRGGTGIICAGTKFIDYMFYENSDALYWAECEGLYDTQPYEPVGDSQVVLYGGCLITE